jgi:hypothetical protein
MRIKYIIILAILFISCFSNIKAQTGDLNSNDSITQYISILESESKITDTPLLVIDGFAIDYEDYQDKNPPLSKFDIKQIDYLSKDSKTAINIYGDRAKGGVLLITTNSIQEKSTKTIDESKVLFLVGDRMISKEELEKINPDDIESIEVIKEKDAVKKITEDNYDGVVIITMKESKKKKTRKKKK